MRKFFGLQLVILGWLLVLLMLVNLWNSINGSSSYFVFSMGVSIVSILSFLAVNSLLVVFSYWLIKKGNQMMKKGSEQA